MKRFSKLEFGDNARKRKIAQGEPVHDQDYFHNQALRYWLAGDFETALRNYSRALEQNSAFYAGWLGQVLCLIELGEYTEANVWADKALELFPEHPELLAVKAVALARDGKMEKALAYSDNSISKDDVTARCWLARAEVLLNRKSEIAESCIDKAVSQAGNDSAIILLEAGRLLSKDGNLSQALYCLQQAVEKLGKSALAWYELGCCQAKLGQDRAAVTLEQSLKLRPGWRLARNALRRSQKRGFWHRLFGR